MKIFIILLLLVSISFADQGINLAIGELDGLGISDLNTKSITSRIRDEFTKSDSFSVVERDKMFEILNEHEFQLSGCTSDECVIEMGKIIGVKQIVTGSVNKVGTLYSIGLRLIDVSTGKVLRVASFDFQGSIEDLFVIGSAEVVNRLIHGIENQNVLDYNTAKYNIVSHAEQEQENSIEQTVRQKSGLKAALLSAVVPGAGEAYAGSYWKAAIFAGLEVAFWSVNYMYNQKGKDEDTDMRTFGDTHWSERRYWSNVYRVVKDDPEWTGGTLIVDADGILNDNSYTAADIDALRPMESVAGFTHSLPTTKTQQYYEMIYKYLHQFGVGWDDVTAEFGDPYFYDTPDNWRYPTSNALEYRDMRDLSNHYYDVAGNMVMMAMVNHLASLFDAAYTVRKQNRKINYSFRMKPQFIGSGYQNTYGLNIIW